MLKNTIISLLSFFLAFSAYTEPLIITNPYQSLADQEQGAKFLRLIIKSNKVINDIELSSYITTLGRKLVIHSDSPKRHFGFYLLEDSSINAFAGAYGYIGIHTGLILASDHEAELAAVMAHEIAHITRNHLTRYEDKTTNNNILITTGILVSLLIKNPEVSQAIAGSTVASIVQRYVNFTREHEIEADKTGLDILLKSKFNPYGMADFFKKLTDDEGAIEYIRTHPLSVNRIVASLQKLTLNNNTYNDSFLYKVIKGRLYYSVVGRPDYTNEKQVNLYMAAYELFDKQQPQEANKKIQELLTINKDRVSYILAARILAANGKYKQAINYLKPLANNGNVEPVVYYLAKMYQKTNNIKQAISIVKKLTKTTVASYYMYDLLAQLYVADNKIARYHSAKAYSLVRQANYTEALIHLKQAEAITKDKDLKDSVSYNIKDLKNVIEVLGKHKNNFIY